MAAILKRITHEHCRYGEQAKDGKSVHWRHFISSANENFIASANFWSMLNRGPGHRLCDAGRKELDFWSRPSCDPFLKGEPG